MSKRATRTRSTAPPASLVALLLVVAHAPRAHARELWASEDLEHVVSLDSALKATWLLSRAPDDPVLFPERDSETGLFRLRLSLGGTFGPHVDSQVSYEHRARLNSDAGGLAGAALLPSTAPAPFRIVSVEQALIDRPGVTHLHELDRAWVALHLAPLELTLGRQAVGLGRGVLFSAIDVLAPFSPLEVDREWRRGVDALNAEVAFGEHLSAGLVGAADEALRQGALLGRVRGYLGDVDGELIGGKRAEDWMLGSSASAVLGDAELHGEAAWFFTDGRGIDGGWLGSARWVAKFVSGGSYQFDIGGGLRLLAEYHYSGFGLQDVSRDAGLLLDPAFVARFTRGDSQVLGRHALALVTSYQVGDALSANLVGLVSPRDGSGLLGPTLTYTHSDTVTLVASSYIPWGAHPRMGMLRSEYGASGISGLLQVRIYD